MAIDFNPAVVMKKIADLRPEVQLQSHQQRLYDEAENNPSNKLLYHALGSGKTLSAIGMAESQKQPYTAISPASLRANWKSEMQKFTDEKTPQHVMSYTELAMGKPIPYQQNLIFDECLPVGTLIDGRPVETYKPGDFVMSINHATGELEQRLVTRTAQRLTNKIFLIELSNGDSFACTEDHSLYTQRGYVPAKEILPQDSLVNLRNGVLNETRVACVSGYEQGSGPEFEQLCPGGVVYDLTVDHNHNFFAAGYLVHNSHRLRNMGTQQTTQALRAAEKARQVTLLSGSPIVNDPMDLAVPARILTGRKISPAWFRQRYVGEKEVKPGFIDRLRGVKPGREEDIQNAKELKAMLRGHVDYYAPHDTVVPVKHEHHAVEMGTEQSQLYRSMWEKLPWHIRWKLKNDFPMNSQELQRSVNFLTGPRQISLSPYPYLKEKDPLKAFHMSPKLMKAHEELQKHLAHPDKKALVFSNFIDAG